jgi:hypothetical protein
MKEPFEDLAARRQALETARALDARGVARVDFLYAYYADENALLGSKAFDADGRMLPSEDALTDWSETVPLTVPGWEPGNLCSYSPKHHQVTTVGEIDWTPDEDDPDAQLHVLVLDTAYEDVIAALTWHPDLPADVMERCVRDTRASVRAAIAANPTIPAALQSQLARDAERPVRTALARNPGLASNVAHELAEDAALYRALATNSNAPADVLSRLVPDDPAAIERALGTYGYREVKERALSNANFPVQRLIDLWRTMPEDVSIAAALAGHPEVPADVVAVLARHVDSKVKSALCDSAPPALTLRLILDMIANSGANDRFAHLALRAYDFSSASGRRELEALLAEPDALVARGLQRFVAQNRTIPSDLFEKLPHDADTYGFLPSNPVTPRPLLARVATEPRWKEQLGRLCIDEARARTFATLPAEECAAAIEPFANSASWEDRGFAARQPGTSSDTLIGLLRLEGLFGDTPSDTHYERERVWQALCQNPSLPVAALLEHGPVEAREWAARERVSTADLAALAQDPGRTVRKAVAQNPRSSPEVLARLADDADASVRQAVLENVATPRNLLPRSSATVEEGAKPSSPSAPPSGWPATNAASAGRIIPPWRMGYGRLTLFLVSLGLLIKSSCGLWSSFTAP